MGLEPTIKRIHSKKPWKWLPPQLWISPLKRLRESGDQLHTPWPDIVISCGRQAIPQSIAIRKASKNKCFTIHIQTPNCRADRFDLVIVPWHDRLRGQNVIVSEGSLTRITTQKLMAEFAKFSDSLQNLASPVVTVLVGGSNKCYDVNPQVMTDLSQHLGSLHEKTGCHFLVTTSRRTGAENISILKRALETIPHQLWSGEGDNPYFAYLHRADAIIVTADSVNMVCEAVTAGKPVYVFDLPGGNKKFNRFHERMKTLNFTRNFTGSLDEWSPAKLSETERIAKIVWDKIGH